MVLEICSDRRSSRRSRSQGRDYHRGCQRRRYEVDLDRRYGGRGGRSSRRHGSRESHLECYRVRSPISAISPRQSLNAHESSSGSRRKAVTKKSNGRGGGGGGGGGKKFYRSSHRSRRHRRSPTPRRNRLPSTSRRSHLLEVGIDSSSTTPFNPLEPVSNASTDVSAKQRRSLVGVFYKCSHIQRFVYTLH
ncbi:unnamed protein product [Rodentolepis nana]|uniref:Arginine/serine-rich protein 1 n=1 Tax=Rodentolepis nana TaxID=102285 RepID=A0A0R3TG81_RODNA|nr:unnamed protein product [Rodentolepis nana]